MPGRFTILIVDDEFASLEVLALMFEATGYRVVAAADGEEALIRLRANPVDLIVTDYMMPRMTGIELCQELLRLDGLSKIPVILVSANHPHDIPRSAQIVAFFAKPLLFDRLLLKVRELLPQLTAQ